MLPLEMELRLSFPWQPIAVQGEPIGTTHCVRAGSVQTWVRGPSETCAEFKKYSSRLMKSQSTPLTVDTIYQARGYF